MTFSPGRQTVNPLAIRVTYGKYPCRPEGADGARIRAGQMREFLPDTTGIERNPSRRGDAFTTH